MRLTYAPIDNIIIVDDVGIVGRFTVPDVYLGTVSTVTWENISGYYETYINDVFKVIPISIEEYDTHILPLYNQWGNTPRSTAFKNTFNVVRTTPQTTIHTYKQVDELVDDSLGSTPVSVDIGILLQISDIVSLYRQEPPIRFKRADGSVISNASTEVPQLFTHLQLPNNTWKCITEEEWQAVSTLFNGIGGVPYFVIDIDANTIRLPDTRGMYSRSGSESVGTVIEAGVPNITATQNSQYGAGSYGHPHLTTAGAFYPIPKDIYLAVNHLSGAAQGLVGFDASRSSSVYGKSTTVTPNTYVTMDCVYTG